jgi:long-chain acyl-CoA synthetase
MDIDTTPKLLRENYKKYGNKKIAFREKDRGLWIPYTWEDYYYKVRYFCLGLVKLGLKRFDKVSILGENKPEWYIAELAAHSAGAISVGIFTDCIPSEVKFYLENSDSVFIVAHDQEQVDKVLQVKNDLPLLKKIIYWDEKGLWHYHDPMIASFDEIIKLGEAYDKENPTLYDTLVDQGCKDDIAIICYTSGTTGLPKGAMLNQEWMLPMVLQWSEVDEWKDKNYEYVSFIPPAWSTEQAIGIGGSLISGLTVNFPEEPETVQDNLREIGPQVLFYGARLWESVSREIQNKILNASRLKQLTYRIFMPVGQRLAKMQEDSVPINFYWRILGFIGYWALFRPMREQLALKRVKVVYSAGAAVSPDIIRLFKAMGIEIKLYYGSTEVGVVSLPRAGDIRAETCGPIIPWAKIKFSEEGEILVKSDFPFSGYYKNEEATKKKLRDGWYYTGDFGYLEERGHLIVIDRMEDLRELKGGEKFSPQYIEVRIRFSTYIKDGLALGGPDKEFVGVLIDIDLKNIGKWAEERNISYTTYTDLSQKPEVIELIEQELRKINKNLPESSRIKKFINMYKEFDPDESEMTRTRKLRRTFVEERFKELVDACYGDKDGIEVSMPIKYRDGREGTIECFVRVTEITN